MNKIAIAILSLLIHAQVFAAQQQLQLRSNTTSPSVDTNFSRQQLMNTEVYTTKADKAQAVRYWADHPDNTEIPAGTILAYNGKLYAAKQAFNKVSTSATPDVLTVYFELTGGNNDYNSLNNRPTLGTAAALNVGTSTNNIPQIGSDGKIPSGIYNAGLESQPAAAGQSLISSGAAAYDWLPNIPLTTNPSGLINSGGTLNLTGFQPLDPALTAAAGLDGSGANKMVGTNSEGTVGVINIPGEPTIQADPPTTSNTKGFYGATSTGGFYYRSDAGIFNLNTGVYTADPTLKTLTITPPLNGTIICNDQALSQSISCPGVCTASAPTDTVVIGINAQGNQGYNYNAFTGDITGSAYNTGTVTLSADKTGSATFTSTALWAIDDPFTINTAGSYTRISGTTATLAVDTVNGNAYNSYTNSTGWFAHSTDLGSTNMVVQAVLTERKNSTTAGGSGVLINTDGVSIGYGVWVNAVNSRMTFTALGSVGTDVIKSFTSGAWVADASHLVQITRNGTTATIEIDFNDDGDFLDTNEQVGTATLSALVNGTKSGIGFNWVQATDTVDNFRAKAL